MNDKLGLAWLKDIFDRYTKEKARRRWRLLILDSHGSHLTMEFINYCDDNKILLMTYLPHLTHSLQLLDIRIFSPLATAYSKLLLPFLASLAASLVIKKYPFFMENCRLLNHMVADIYDKNTKKLSSTMHHLSTENILLKLRCQGLESALQNEKKKR
ncbi:hypothetical protein GB937_010023 [Aspergillus fischeri]|nr:hypothetical protein GB937_010023 [Aspergillus fischeri]